MGGATTRSSSTRTAPAIPTSQSSYVFQNSYVYDAFGRVVTRTYPDTEVFDFVYDGLRLTAIEAVSGLPGNELFDILMSASYDPLGRTVQLDVGETLGGSPAAVLARTYDPQTARLVGMTATGRNASPANLDLTVSFDGLGRLESQSGSYGATALGTRSFTYDGLGRLQTATGPWEQPEGNPNPVSWTYAYDPLGNLREQTSDNPDPATDYVRSLDETTWVEPGTRPDVQVDGGAG